MKPHCHIKRGFRDNPPPPTNKIRAHLQQIGETMEILFSVKWRPSPKRTGPFCIRDDSVCYIPFNPSQSRFWGVIIIIYLFETYETQLVEQKDHTNILDRDCWSDMDLPLSTVSVQIMLKTTGEGRFYGSLDRPPKITLKILEGGRRRHRLLDETA